MKAEPSKIKLEQLRNAFESTWRPRSRTMHFTSIKVVPRISMLGWRSVWKERRQQNLHKSDICGRRVRSLAFKIRESNDQVPQFSRNLARNFNPSPAYAWSFFNHIAGMEGLGSYTPQGYLNTSLDGAFKVRSKLGVISRSSVDLSSSGPWWRQLFSSTLLAGSLCNEQAFMEY